MADKWATPNETNITFCIYVMIGYLFALICNVRRGYVSDIDAPLSNTRVAPVHNDQPYWMIPSD